MRILSLDSGTLPPYLLLYEQQMLLLYCDKWREKMQTVETTIVEMLTEPTGKNFLDSGGENGRHWQKNADKDMQHWRSQPSATLEVDIREWRGKPCADLELTVSTFHMLTGGGLKLDDLCKEFNAMPVENWRADVHGVSHEGMEWLEARRFHLGNPFNSYNWERHFSQEIQGHFLTRAPEHDKRYVLLQIHNGADVRGGYTDARLFLIDEYAQQLQFAMAVWGFYVEANDDEICDHITWSGEWINSEGGPATDSELLEFATAAMAGRENERVVLEGDAFTDF